MKIVHCNKHLFDVFIGDGWEQWARFEVVRTGTRKFLKKHGGIRLPDSVMSSLKGKVL